MMAFKDEYPHLSGCLTWLGFMMLIGIGNAIYANHRYNEGVEQGRAQQLCEIGGMMKLAELPQSCREWLTHSHKEDNDG